MNDGVKMRVCGK